VVRAGVYAVLLSLASAVPLTVLAQDVAAPIHFGPAEVSSGKTLTLSDGAKLGIFPGALPVESDVTWASESKTSLPALPANRTALGSAYRVEMTGVTAFSAGVARPTAVGLPDGKSLWNRQIWQYSHTTKTWTALKTGISADRKLMQAAPTITSGFLAILENRNLQEGIGSWYCKNSCSTRYPKYHGTSNDFPVGSIVKVTNPDNGAAVQVKIISKWGQPEGRVVDLSYVAFAALRSKNDGLTRVTVRPATNTTLGPVSAASTPTAPQTTLQYRAETLPSFSVLADGVKAPNVQASGYAVYDQTSGKMLASFKPDTVRPIASITKLMTVMVFLDKKVDLAKVMTYQSSDAAECSCLKVVAGEKFTVKDVLYTTLVGSANNTAKMLARSTGLTSAEFVAAMNAKAKSLGLTKTSFADPSGLSPKNVSTPAELTKLAAHAFNKYSEIRTITTMTKYSFTTINTKKPHTITLRYSLVGTANMGTKIATGSKTGYTEEAGRTYVFRAKNAQGAQVVISILGSPSEIQRNADVAKLLHWAFGHHSWK